MHVLYLFCISPRDLKLKQTTVNRLEEITQEVKFESKQRLDNEKEMRTNIETMSNKLKLYTDESVEAARVMLTVNEIIFCSFVK